MAGSLLLYGHSLIRQIASFRTEVTEWAYYTVKFCRITNITATYWLCERYVVCWGVFGVRLLSVLRGHSFFSSPPQRPMTSDYEGFSIPDCIHYICFPILILEKEPVFPFWCWVPKKRTPGTILLRLWYDAVLDWGLNPGPPALEASTLPLGYRRGDWKICDIHTVCVNSGDSRERFIKGFWTLCKMWYNFNNQCLPHNVSFLTVLSYYIKTVRLPVLFIDIWASIKTMSK